MSSPQEQQASTPLLVRLIDNNNNNSPDTPRTEKRKKKTQEVVRKLSYSGTVEENLGWVIPEKDITLGNELGAGAFGTVYKAHYLGLDVCVKEIKMNHEGTTADEFDHEVRMLRSLRHPLIVLFMGISYTLTGHFYIVQEFVSGGSLLSLLQKKEIPLPWVARIKMGLEIAEALNYLHARGVIHRDLKCENILLEKPTYDDIAPNTLDESIEYRCKVADFGLATLFDPNAEKHSVREEVGSVWWRAPEIFKQKYDKRCDYFSLGVVLVEIITRDLGEEIRINMTIERKEEGNTVFGVKPEQLRKEYSDAYKRAPTVMFETAIQCCQEDPENRPPITDIVQALSNLYDISTQVKRVARQQIKCKRGVSIWLSAVFQQENKIDFDPTNLGVSVDYLQAALAFDYKSELQVPLSDYGLIFLKNSFFNEKICPQKKMTVGEFAKLWTWWKKTIKTLKHRLIYPYVQCDAIHGLITNNQATKLLTDKNQPGTFIFRVSANSTGLVLTCFTNKVAHIIIHVEESTILIGNDHFKNLQDIFEDTSKGLNKLKYVYPDRDWCEDEKIKEAHKKAFEESTEIKGSYFQNSLDD